MSFVAAVVPQLATNEQQLDNRVSRERGSFRTADIGITCLQVVGKRSSLTLLFRFFISDECSARKIATAARNDDMAYFFGSRTDSPRREVIDHTTSTDPNIATSEIDASPKQLVN
eukprot:5529598-Amphidinium_carterae.1